jgi:hypothetical protein
MIKKSVFVLLVVCLVVFLLGCSSGYVKKDGKWQYKAWNESWGVYYQELKGVDNATFKVRKDGLGQDKNAIWVKARKMDVDVASFEKIDGRYYKDKDGAYFLSSAFLEKLAGADAGKLKVFHKYWATDGSRVYYYDERVPEVDAASFKATSEYYGVDKHHVWHKTHVISIKRQGASRAIDRASFVDLGNNNAKDKHGKIKYGRPVEDIKF